MEAAGTLQEKTEEEEITHQHSFPWISALVQLVWDGTDQVHHSNKYDQGPVDLHQQASSLAP